MIEDFGSGATFSLLFLLSLPFFYRLPCYYFPADSDIDEVNIDEVLLSVPEIIMPLAVDRVDKGASQTTGRGKERNQKEAGEITIADHPQVPQAGTSSATSGQSFPNDCEFLRLFLK